MSDQPRFGVVHVVSRLPDPARAALLKAVTALWFGDNADYGTALWEVVHILRPGLPEDVDLEVLRNTLIEEGAE